MSTSNYFNFVCLFVLAFVSTFAKANVERHKWEFGLGAAYISYPDYPGSSEQEDLLLPLPYFVYRSDSLLVDNNEITKSLFDSERLELNFSVIGGMPVDSDDNEKRSGMDDLDAYVGIGPSIQYRLFKQAQNELKFELPIHAIAAVSLEGIHHEGWQLEPGLFYYVKSNIKSNNRLEIKTGVSLQYADSKFHNYLYGVSQKDTLPDRSFFESSSGFSGVNYKLGLDWYFDDFKLGAFLRGRDISQSVYRDSPLVEDTFSHSYGFFLSWRFLKSKEKVLVLD